MSVGIVAQDPMAVGVGADVLRRGGNAVDAAVATAFAQCVVSPFMTSLGGSARLHLFDGRSRRTTLLDAAAEVGSRPTPSSWEDEGLRRIESLGQYQLASRANLVGGWSVMVPGFVKGCWVAHERYGGGRLSWRELLLPAIALAEGGVQIDATLAGAWDDGTGAELSTMATTERLQVSEASRRIYLKRDGAGYEQGDILRNPELARTLRRLADAGGDDFYHGEIAREMAADLASRGSTVTREDLEAYQAREVAPLVGSLRGLEIRTTPPPSQGPLVAEMLQIAARSIPPDVPYDSVAYLGLLADVQRAAFADALGVAEGALDVADVMGDARAERWAAHLRSGLHVTVPAPVPTEPGTTHVSAIDQEGNIALLTHSIGSSGGSGVVTGGLGFLYNNFLGHLRPRAGFPDAICPGKRMGGGAPTFLFENGEPRLAVGAAGGSRLVSAMAQTVVNAVLFHLRPQEAVSLPRVHSEEGRIVFVEEAFPAGLLEGLRERGHDARRSKPQARVQLVVIGQDGTAELAADPRGGQARVVRR